MGEACLYMANDGASQPSIAYDCSRRSLLDGFDIFSILPPKQSSAALFSEALTKPTSTLDDIEDIPYLEETDDECSSISSCSSSSAFSRKSQIRVVSFASQLVTEVRSRPRTLIEDLPSLYYTSDETKIFRQEYREERKLLSPVESDEGRSCGGQIGSNIRHRISRVVVLHQDNLETFVDQDSPIKTHSVTDTEYSKTAKVDFFDIDSFWSGSITWY